MNTMTLHQLQKSESKHAVSLKPNRPRRCPKHENILGKVLESPKSFKTAGPLIPLPCITFPFFPPVPWASLLPQMDSHHSFKGPISGCFTRSPARSSGVGAVKRGGESGSAPCKAVRRFGQNWLGGKSKNTSVNWCIFLNEICAQFCFLVAICCHPSPSVGLSNF